MQPSSLPYRPEEKRGLIVVIEDNPTDVFLIQRALAAFRVDADVRLLGDGEEAIRLIQDIQTDESLPCPDLILMDINLPRLDGFQVLTELRKSPRCANVPVVVMTSSAAKTDRVRAADLKVEAYFQKPNAYDAFLRLGDLVRRALHQA